MFDDIINKINASLIKLSSDDSARVDISGDFEHGDLTTNIAMREARFRKKPAMELAEEWAEKLVADKALRKYFCKIEAVPPGFINFYYNDAYLKQELENILTSDSYGQKNIGKNKKVIIEYSSPNTNKPLHVGHLRNHAMGMALANMVEYLGFRVIKTQIINDRGIHIMKSLLAYQQWGKNKTPEDLGLKPDKMVGDFYVMYGRAEKENPAIIDKARKLLQSWEAGDSAVRDLWKKMNKWVYAGWQQTYKIYGSKFDEGDYESELYDKGREIIEQAVKEGKFYKNSDGAVVADLSADNLGGRENGEKILLRADGTTIYMTQDIYLAAQRYKKHKFDKMFYVVGDEQIYHFKVLFMLLTKLGFSWVDKLIHYSYAHVLLPEGKMKSREGKVVDADDLIEELIDLATVEVVKRQPDLDKDDVSKTAKAIALAAIKYWFLKTNPKSIIHFDPKQSLDFEGNTGPYLLYTYVRLQSILRRAGSLSSASKLMELPTEEKEVMRKISAWPLVVGSFIKHYNINIVCEYLFDLASYLNSYYHKAPVLKAQKDTREMRLQIIAAGIKVLKKGLDLMNIETVEKM